MTQALTAELILTRLVELTAVDDQSWQSGKFDYVADLRVSSADIPELIRIARWWMEPWDEWPDEVRDSNALLHAGRTLGKLAAVEAIPVLLESMNSLEADREEWYLDDFPAIFTLFGPAGIGALSSYAAETTHNESCRSLVVDALCSIACGS